MGVIRKQSLQTSILSYVGMVLGYVNIILLFPEVLTPEEFGLTRILISIVGVGSQFALFGLSNSILKFLPRFKEGDPEQHHGILGLTMLLSMFGALIVSVILLLGRPWFEDMFADGSLLVSEFYLFIIPFLWFEVGFQLLSNYTRGLFKSVLNIFMRDVFLRLCTSVLIGLYYFGYINFFAFMQLFVGQFAIMMGIMLIYLAAIGRFDWKIDFNFLTKDLKNELFKYSSFTLLSAASAMLVVRLDLIMIGAMIGLEQTAFYAVAFYIMSVINIPKGALANISVPVVSEAWKNNDLKQIQTIYSKTSDNLLLLGILLFFGIWANADNIFSILPDEYADGKWVLFVVGIARLVDVGFGVNGGILITSGKYKFDTYFNVILLILTIVLNLAFIPSYGIVGAAFATAISLALYNLAKYLFLKKQYGLSPFSRRSVLTVLIGCVAYFASTFMEQQELFLDIFLRSMIITVIFVPAALILGLSQDAVEFVVALRKRIGI